MSLDFAVVMLSTPKKTDVDVTVVEVQAVTQSPTANQPNDDK